LKNTLFWNRVVNRGKNNYSSASQAPVDKEEISFISNKSKLKNIKFASLSNFT
jgi:hypothetical protein